MLELTTSAIPDVLAPYIASIWTVCGSGADDHTERVFGTGNATLLIHCGNRFTNRSIGRESAPQAEFSICGQLTEYRDVTASGHTDTIAISFSALGLAAFTACPLWQLTDRTVDAAAVSHRLAQTAARVATVEPGSDRIAALIRELMSSCSKPETTAYRAVTAAMQLIAASGGRCRVSQIGARLGIEERTLQRWFRRYIGLPPKRVCELTRIGAAIDRMQSSALLTEIALDVGYYDQAQFSSAFRTFTGYSPQTFRQLACSV